ncbi:D-aminoacyl-tRNA deacylase DTD [Kipferlia bialata]|uniref:D-aminoacyl-tRNA deacylase n=1 Tax=Kipferlia bialata TaxID=797122 RepID=A0A9K3GE74_9EUKA|nr:D-aminoacyl-tRNA deacylase DTD [Kipferlia bialata]|eukprot:g1537.t1
MKVIIQRVREASVTIEDVETPYVSGAIEQGYMVLLGINWDDMRADMTYIVRKVLNVKLFPDEQGRPWKKSVKDAGYGVLLVPQFTLYGQLKGNRPDFHNALNPKEAEPFFDRCVTAFREEYNGEAVQTGAIMPMFNQVYITSTFVSLKGLKTQARLNGRLAKILGPPLLRPDGQFRLQVRVQGTDGKVMAVRDTNVVETWPSPQDLKPFQTPVMVGWTFLDSGNINMAQNVCLSGHMMGQQNKYAELEARVHAVRDSLTVPPPFHYFANLLVQTHQRAQQTDNWRATDPYAALVSAIRTCPCIVTLRLVVPPPRLLRDIQPPAIVSCFLKLQRALSSKTLAMAMDEVMDAYNGGSVLTDEADRVAVRWFMAYACLDLGAHPKAVIFTTEILHDIAAGKLPGSFLPEALYMQAVAYRGKGTGRASSPEGCAETMERYAAVATCDDRHARFARSMSAWARGEEDSEGDDGYMGLMGSAAMDREWLGKMPYHSP